MKGQGANDLIVDPEFTDLAGNDFSLAAGSPGIHAGIDAGLRFTQDMAGLNCPRGIHPNLGCYETDLLSRVTPA